MLIDKNIKNIANKKFDDNRLYNDFENILSMRKMDNPAMGLFAILFAETSAGSEAELNRVLVIDYSEYVNCNTPIGVCSPHLGHSFKETPL